MKRVLMILLVASCGTSTPLNPTPPGGSSPDAPAIGPVTTVDADITADTTWSGTVNVTKAIQVAAGATLTISAGTTVLFAEEANLTVAGTINATGVKGQVVTIAGATATAWGSVDLKTGAAVSLSYVEYTGGNIDVVAGATLTIRDSELSHVSGDLLTASGGTIDVQYSWLGVDTGIHDTTHCDLHFEGNGGPLITVSHSNISTSVYGVMFYTGVGADFTYDNWFSNSTQVDATSAVMGDFSHGYFDAHPPSGTGITATDLQSARISDAGPR